MHLAIIAAILLIAYHLVGIVLTSPEFIQSRRVGFLAFQIVIHATVLALLAFSLGMIGL